MQEKGFFSSRGLPFLFLAPQILIILIFFIWPAAQTLFESFVIENTAALPPHQLTGLENYIALFKSPTYLYSLGMTLVFSFCVTIIALVGGFFLAQLVHYTARGKIIYQVLFCLPVVVAPPVAGIIMRCLFSSTMGMMVLTASWQQISYSFIFYLISLRIIPSSLIDSAKLDGANFFQRQWHIILPLLAPTTFFLFITNLLLAFFNTFGLVQVMTESNGTHPAQLLMLKVYQDGFIHADLPSAAAQSVILMIIAGILIVPLYRYFLYPKIQ